LVRRRPAGPARAWSARRRTVAARAPCRASQSPWPRVSGRRVVACLHGACAENAHAVTARKRDSVTGEALIGEPLAPRGGVLPLSDPPWQRAPWSQRTWCSGGAEAAGAARRPAGLGGAEARAAAADGAAAADRRLGAHRAVQRQRCLRAHVHRAQGGPRRRRTSSRASCGLLDAGARSCSAGCACAAFSRSAGGVRCAGSASLRSAAVVRGAGQPACHCESCTQTVRGRGWRCYVRCMRMMRAPP